MTCGAAFSLPLPIFGSAPPLDITLAPRQWTGEGLGCAPGMSTPKVFRRVQRLAGCDHGTLRYVMGHTHCNRVAETAWSQHSHSTAAAQPQPQHSRTHGTATAAKEPIGYLLGGAGVRGDVMGCNTFGFGYSATGGGRELMVGFDLANSTADRFDEIVGCFEARGIGECLQYGQVWRNTSS